MKCAAVLLILIPSLAFAMSKKPQAAYMPGGNKSDASSTAANADSKRNLPSVPTAPFNRACTETTKAAQLLRMSAEKKLNDATAAGDVAGQTLARCQEGAAYFALTQAQMYVCSGSLTLAAFKDMSAQAQANCVSGNSSSNDAVASQPAAVTLPTAASSQAASRVPASAPASPAARSKAVQ